MSAPTAPTDDFRRALNAVEEFGCNPTTFNLPEFLARQSSHDPLWDGDPISFFAGIKATGSVTECLDQAEP